MIGSWPVRLAVLAIRGYRAALTPFFGPCCRFAPSCSAYCEEALVVHGFWRGMALGLRRLGRCRPLGSAGWDPVPGTEA